MRTRSNFVFLAVALMAMAAIFGGCESITKITAPDQVTDQPGQTGPADPGAIAMLGKTVAELNSAGYRICGDFTRGFEELKTGYSVQYDRELQTVLESPEGTPTVRGVTINGTPVDLRSYYMGRFCFSLPYGQTKPVFIVKNKAGVVDANIQVSGYGDADSVYVRSSFYSPYSPGVFNEWKWIPLAKKTSGWERSFAVTASDTFRTNILVVRGGRRDYYKDGLVVNSTPITTGTITWSGNQITGSSADFVIKPDGTAVSVGKDNLLMGTIGINP